MGVGTPDSAAQVEDRIKADVQREAPDSNPYLTIHWLRSLIAGIARRIFDFYGDLERTEQRLFPDTADDETAPRWGNIYVGPPNPATAATGKATATGTVGGTIPVGASLIAGGLEYTVTAGGAIAVNAISVLTISRIGSVATATTASPHNLSSFVPVTLTGSDQPEYNVTDAAITVTGLNTFTYVVSGTPVTPSTGSSTATYTSASVTVQSVDFGDETNLDLDTPLALQSPIANVDDTLRVDFGAIGGGTDEEALEDYIARYLDKLRNPVAHYNVSDLVAKAKEIAGVTRVFVEPANTAVSDVSVTSITRNANVATVTTAAPHGYDDGMTTTITGALEPAYNVVGARIIVESTTVFHYVVAGTPTTPATGTILAAAQVPLGQTRVFFMRDNDPSPIPTGSEVTTVKNKLDEILPANTASSDLIVNAPVAVPTDFTFSEVTPNTTTMRTAVEENLGQFFEEQTVVGLDVDEDLYRAAVANTVDPDTGDTVATFTLLVPSGDIAVGSGQIATLGIVTFL